MISGTKERVFEIEEDRSLTEQLGLVLALSLQAPLDMLGADPIDQILQA